MIIPTYPGRADSFEARYQTQPVLNRHIEARDLGWANILPTLISLLPERGHFLDVGSGVGTVACLIAARGLEVTALDRAPSGVALGNAQARALGVSDVTFAQYDLDSDFPLPLSTRVDFVFASEVLEHVRDDRDVMRRIRGVMRPGALLLATSPAADAPMHHLHIRLRGVDHMDVERHHLRRYTPHSFSAAALDACLEVAAVRPIGGLVRDFFFGSHLGLRASRFVKRPITPLIQRLDSATLSFAPSQLVLIARAPSDSTT